MKRIKRASARPRNCADADGGDMPDPYGDFPEYIEAMLDGAAGPAKRRHPR